MKLYGWELSFKNLIEKLRNNELGYLHKTAIFDALINLALQFSGFLISGLSFLTFILIDSNNKLDASTVFVSIALFGQLKFPLLNLASCITNCIQVIISYLIRVI